MKKKISALVAMISMYLLVSSTFCFAAEVNYEKQEAMADETLKHLGEHYLLNTSGGKGYTTPKVWDGIECTTWKKYHKTEKISCIGVRHFDCTGFVSFCARAVGYDLGHLGAQYFYDHGPIIHIPLSKIRKGTIIFKGWGPNPRQVGHAAIYLGNGKVIECGGARARVCITSWDAWLEGARRGENHLLAGNLLYPEEKIRARDAKRIQDLKQVQFALELYYKQTKSYPQGTFFSVWDTNYGHATNYWSGGKFPWSTALYDALVGNGYLDSLPLDPINSEAGDGNFLRDGPSTDRGYVYWSDNRQRYLLGTNLEEDSASPDNWGNYQIKGGNW